MGPFLALVHMKVTQKLFIGLETQLPIQFLGFIFAFILNYLFQLKKKKKSL